MLKSDISIQILIELHDPYITGHQQRVASLVCAIGEEIGLSQKRIGSVRLAAAMHDIGKICVPAEILSRPGGSGKVQAELVRSHPRIGYELLKKAHFPWPVPDIVYQHHERMDGSGYPQGLSGDDIAHEARILAVADTVDVMAGLPSCQQAHDITRIHHELSENAGVLYDPDAVNACLRLLTERGFSLRFGTR